MALRRMGGLPRKRASEANRNKKPCLATLLTLLTLLAWRRRQGGGFSIILGQKKIIERRPGNAGDGFEKLIARSTLNRQLAALEHLGYIHRIQRHYRLRNGEVRQRKTLFTFGSPAIELVKRCAFIGQIPRGRLRVPFSVHNQEALLKPSGLRRAVDKSSAPASAAQSRPPRKARG